MVTATDYMKGSHIQGWSAALAIWHPKVNTICSSINQPALLRLQHIGQSISKKCTTLLQPTWSQLKTDYQTSTMKPRYRSTYSNSSDVTTILPYTQAIYSCCNILLTNQIWNKLHDISFTPSNYPLPLLNIKEFASTIYFICIHSKITEDTNHDLVISSMTPHNQNYIVTHFITTHQTTA